MSHTIRVRALVALGQTTRSSRPKGIEERRSDSEATGALLPEEYADRDHGRHAWPVDPGRRRRPGDRRARSPCRTLSAPAERAASDALRERPGALRRLRRRSGSDGSVRLAGRPARPARSTSTPRRPTKLGTRRPATRSAHRSPGRPRRSRVRDVVDVRRRRHRRRRPCSCRSRRHSGCSASRGDRQASSSPTAAARSRRGHSDAVCAMLRPVARPARAGGRQHQAGRARAGRRGRRRASCRSSRPSASFSIAAGILLIFLIFVMLAAERRGELGIARAVGTRRGHLVQMFLFEGIAYDLLAAAVGALLGVAVAFGMVLAMARAFAVTERRRDRVPRQARERRPRVRDRRAADARRRRRSPPGASAG